jgi:biopolymer transport protein ExbD
MSSSSCSSGTATITVTQEGTMAWDKDPVTLDEFIARLQQFHIEHPDDARILINGDADASFSSVIYVFDEVRKVGISKVLIETTVKSAASAGS